MGPRPPNIYTCTLHSAQQGKLFCLIFGATVKILMTNTESIPQEWSISGKPTAGGWWCDYHDNASWSCWLVGCLVLKKGQKFILFSFFGHTYKVQRCLLSWPVGPSLKQRSYPLASITNNYISILCQKNLRDEVPYNHRALHFAWFSPILSWPRIMFSKRVCYDFFNHCYKCCKMFW